MADVGRIEFGPEVSSKPYKLNKGIDKDYPEFFDPPNNFPYGIGVTDKETTIMDEIDEVIKNAANKLPKSFGNMNGTLQKCHKQENMFNPFYEERIEEDYHPHDALSRQVGGSHYKQYKIQPYEFFIKNQIPHHKAAIIRRILRYDHPTGKGLEDLQKIQHEIDLIIQLENWEERSGTPTETEEDR